MATSIVTPDASAGAMGGFSDTASAIDSILDAPGETPSEVEAAPAPVSEEQPAADIEAEPEETGETQELPSEDDDEIDPDSIDLENRNHYRVDPNRMKRFVQANKFIKAIEEYAPTVEAVKELHTNASDFRAMQIEFQSGATDAVGKFLDFWGGGSPDGFSAMAQQLPGYLASKAVAGDQQALKALSGMEGLVRGADVNRAYARAAQTGDEADMWKAKALDFIHNGKTRFNSVDDIPKQDPARAAQSEQQKREAALNTREQTFIKAQWDGFDKQNLTGAKESALQQEVDNAFKVVEGRYPEKVLSALKREAIAEIGAALQNSFEWHRNHNLEVGDIQRDFANSIKAGTKTNVEPRAQALVNDYRSRAARVLPGIVKPLIAGATKTVVDQNKATHQKLAASAAKSAPGGGGRPAPRSIVNTDNWKSASEGLDALLG